MSHTTVDFIFVFCLDFSHIYLKIPLKCRKYPIKKVRSFINSYSLHNWKYVVPYVTVTCPIRYGDLSHTFKIIIVNLFDIKMKLCYILITKIYYWNYFHSFKCVVQGFSKWGIFLPRGGMETSRGGMGRIGQVWEDLGCSIENLTSKLQKMKISSLPLLDMH